MSESPLRITQGPEGSMCLLGELDMGSASDLLEAFNENGSIDRPLTLDLSGLTFMDGSGVNAILQILEKMRGMTLTLKEPQKPVFRLLQIVKADEWAGLRIIE